MLFMDQSLFFFRMKIRSRLRTNFAILLKADEKLTLTIEIPTRVKTLYEPDIHSVLFYSYSFFFCSVRCVSSIRLIFLDRMLISFFLSHSLWLSFLLPLLLPLFVSFSFCPSIIYFGPNEISTGRYNFISSHLL